MRSPDVRAAIHLATRNRVDSAVDTEHADSHGWDIGTVVDITTANGRQPFVVRATYDDAKEWIGSYFVDVAAFERIAPSQLDFRIYAVWRRHRHPPGKRRVRQCRGSRRR